MAKLKRGQKLCKACGSVNASRQRVCKCCKTEFVSKNTPIKNEVLDWQNLEIGAYIKVVQGTGPYFIPSQDSEEVVAGERICLGSTGVFKVVGIDAKGIRAYGVSKVNSGFCFIYMGESRKSPVTGTHLEAHRIKRVKRKRGMR